MGLIKTLIEEWKYRFGAPKPDDTKNDDTKPIWKAATFSWLCEQEGYGLATGGREQPPNGITYGSMTTIDGEGWSVICNLLNGRICFLSPDAPSHKLVPGFVLDLMEGARKVGTATIQSNTVGGWYDGLSEQDWKDIGFEKMPTVPGMMERYCEPDLCVVCGKSGVMERGKHGADWYHKECYPKLVAPPYQNAQEAWAERVQINANKQWICAARCDCGAIPGSWKRAQVCRDKGYCGCVPATDHNLIDVKCKDCSRVLYRIQDRPDLKDIGFEKMPAVPRTKPASGNSDFNLSSVWLRQHRHEYAGQWVALIGASWIDSHKERAVLQERIKDRPDIKDILVVYCEPKMPWEDTTDGRVCLRCGKVNPAPQEDCTAGEEVPGGGMEPHIFDPKFKPYDFAAQDRNKQRAHRGRCATGGYCPHPTHKKDDKQYYDGSDQNQIVPGSPEWRERYERFGCDESWWFCTNKFCRCNPDEQAPPDDFYCGCVRLTDDLKPERCRTCSSLMVHRDCVVGGSSRMCEYGTRGCVVVHKKDEHLRWGVYKLTEQKFVGCSDQCNGSFEDADGTARYLNEKYGHNDHNYEARVMPVGTVKILPEIDVGVLQARVSELEKINAYAAEQLLSLANEQRHRKHGCRYPVIEPEDLDEVVDVLTGKTSI